MCIKKASMQLLILSMILFPNFSPAIAGIIFQDNFDNSPDWQSQQTVHKSQPEGDDIHFGITRSDTCTTHCPPQGWTSYRTASSHWADDRRKDTYILSTEGARGSSGKGITYNVEVADGAWSGGSLDLWLGEAGYDELYVRYYLKYDSKWKWSNSEDSRSCLQKLLRINTFNDNIWTSSITPHLFFSAGLNRPVYTTLRQHRPAPVSETCMSIDVRKAPDYDASGDSHPNALFPDDGEWHCYEFYAKMNSVPGAKDGEYRFYLDGVQQYERTDVDWKMAGSNTTHKWNWLMFIDNVANASAPSTDHVEMTLYMDDVVVSTEYIGPDDDDDLTRTIKLAPPTF